MKKKPQGFLGCNLFYSQINNFEINLVSDIILKMSANELPALPENEKTYAGIPEAVFVVSNAK